MESGALTGEYLQLWSILKLEMTSFLKKMLWPSSGFNAVPVAFAEKLVPRIETGVLNDNGKLFIQMFMVVTGLLITGDIF